MNAEPMLAELATAIARLDSQTVSTLVGQALAAGVAPADILARGLSAGMRRVGDAFNAGEMFMPELLVAAEVYLAGLAIVRPHLAAAGGQPSLGTMVLGSIYGDIHTVGKMVAIPVFEAHGLRVIDLGENLDDDVFVDAIKLHQPEIVGFGTYMTPTFMHTRAAVAVIARAGLRDRVKIICGGPAVDAQAARRMGADDACDDAWQAVGRIERLIGELRAERRGGGQ